MSISSDYDVFLGDRALYTDSSKITLSSSVTESLVLPKIGGMEKTAFIYTPPGSTAAIYISEVKILDTANHPSTSKTSTFVLTDFQGNDYEVSLYGISDSRRAYDSQTDEPGTQWGNFQTETLYDTLNHAILNEHVVIFHQVDIVDGVNVVSMEARQNDGDNLFSLTRGSVDLNMKLVENGIMEPANTATNAPLPAFATNVTGMQEAASRGNNKGIFGAGESLAKQAEVMENNLKKLMETASFINSRYGKMPDSVDVNDVIIGDVLLKINPVNIQISQMRTSSAVELIGENPHPSSSSVNRLVIKINAVFSGVNEINNNLKRILLQYRFCPINLIRSHDIFDKVSGEASFLEQDYKDTGFIPVTMDEYVLWNVEGSPNSVGITMQFSLFNYKAYFTQGSTDRVEYFKVDLDDLGTGYSISEDYTNDQLKAISKEKIARDTEASMHRPGRTLHLSDAVHPYNMWVESSLAREGELWVDGNDSSVEIIKVAKIDALLAGLQSTLPEKKYGELSADDIGENTGDISVFGDTLVSLVAESINVYYSNNFAWQASLGYSQPVAQYIGPGTCTVGLHAKTNDNKIVNKLLRTYNEQYKAGRKYDNRYIVESSMTAISNTRVCSMRDCNITNSQGNPGWFDINLSFFRDIYALHKIEENPAGEFDEYWGLQRLLRAYSDPKVLELVNLVENQAENESFIVDGDNGEPLLNTKAGSVQPKKLRIDIRCALDKVLDKIQKFSMKAELGVEQKARQIRGLKNKALLPYYAQNRYDVAIDGADVVNRMLVTQSNLDGHDEQIVARALERFIKETNIKFGKFDESDKRIFVRSKNFWNIERLLIEESQEGYIARKIFLEEYGLGNDIDTTGAGEYQRMTLSKINNLGSFDGSDTEFGGGVPPAVEVGRAIISSFSNRSADTLRKVKLLWSKSTPGIANRDLIVIDFQGNTAEANLIFLAFIAGNELAGNDYILARKNLGFIDDVGWPEFIVGFAGKNKSTEQSRESSSSEAYTKIQTWTFFITYQGRDTGPISDWLKKFSYNPDVSEELAARLKYISEKRTNDISFASKPFAAHRYYPGAKIFINASPIDSGTVGSWYAQDRWESMGDELLSAQKAADGAIAPFKNTAAWQSVYLEEQYGGLYIDMINEDVYSPLKLMETLVYPQAKKDFSGSAKRYIQKNGQQTKDTSINVFNSGSLQLIGSNEEDRPFSSFSDYIFWAGYNNRSNQVVASGITAGKAAQDLQKAMIKRSRPTDSYTYRSDGPQISKMMDSSAGNRRINIDGELKSVSSTHPAEKAKIVERPEWPETGLLRTPIILNSNAEALRENFILAGLTADTASNIDNSSSIISDRTPSIVIPSSTTYLDKNFNRIFGFGYYLYKEQSLYGVDKIPEYSEKLINKYMFMSHKFEMEEALKEFKLKVPNSYYRFVTPVDAAEYFEYHEIPTSKIKAYAEKYSNTERLDDNTKSLISSQYINSLMSTSGLENAFPTFKLYIIESDTSDIKYYSLDDYYDYRLLQDAMVVRDRDNPSHILKARVIIDERYVSIAKGSTQTSRQYTGRAGLEGEASSPRANILDTKNENSFMGASSETENMFVGGVVPLREGMRVCLKLGYHTDPRLLDSVFIGTITGLQEMGDGVTYLLEARGDGRELTVPASEGNTENVTGENYSEIIRKIMRANTSVVHFGKVYGSYLEKLSREHYAILALGRVGVETAGVFGTGAGIAGTGALAARGLRFNFGKILLKNKRMTFGAGGLFAVVYGAFNGLGTEFMEAGASIGHGLWETGTHYAASREPFGIATKWNEILNWTQGNVFDLRKSSKQTSKIMYETFRRNNDPVDDNIFAVDIWNSLLGSDFNMTINNKKSIWDCFVDIKRCYPNFALDVRPYGNRSTLYLGPKRFHYWRTDDPVIAMAPQLHTISNTLTLVDKDYQNILEGFSKRNFSGELDSQSKSAAHFIPFQKHHVVSSEGEIISNGIRCTPDRGWNKVVVAYGKNASSDKDPDVWQLVANASIESGELRTKYAMIDWTTDPQMAKQYAVGLLKDGVERMYGGTLTIRGNSKVEPYDMVYIADRVNQMYGWFQVDTVIHKFDRNMGFTTHIVPNLVCAINCDVYNTFWTVFRKQISDQLADSSLAGWLTAGAMAAGGGFAMHTGLAAATAAGLAVWPISLLIAGSICAWSIYEVGKTLTHTLDDVEAKAEIQAMNFQARKANAYIPEVLRAVTLNTMLVGSYNAGMIGAYALRGLRGVKKGAGRSISFVKDLPLELSNMKKSFASMIARKMIDLDTARMARMLDEVIGPMMGVKNVSQMTVAEVEAAYLVRHNQMMELEKTSPRSKYSQAFGGRTDAEVMETARHIKAKADAAKARSPFAGVANKGMKIMKLARGGLFTGLLIMLETIPYTFNSYIVNELSDSNVIVISPLWSRNSFMMTGLEGYTAQNSYMHIHDKIINAKGVLGNTLDMAREWAPAIFTNGLNEDYNVVLDDNKFDPTRIIPTQSYESLGLTKKENIAPVKEEPVVTAPVETNKMLTKEKPVYVESDPTVQEAIKRSATKHNFDPDLIRAIIKQESTWNKFAKSPKDAYGLMQMLPKTAREDFNIDDVAIFSENPAYAVEIGVEYLSRVRRYLGTSDLDWLLSGYNWGMGNTKENYGPGYHISETDEYIVKVKQYFKEYKEKNKS